MISFLKDDAGIILNRAKRRKKLCVSVLPYSVCDTQLFLHNIKTNMTEIGGYCATAGVYFQCPNIQLVL